LQTKNTIRVGFDPTTVCARVLHANTRVQ